MHVEIYKNPECRRIESVITKKVKELVLQEIISFDDLQREDDNWLLKILEENGCQISPFANPDEIGWGKFSSQADCQEFEKTLDKKFILTEEIKPFKTGLDWLVLSEGKTIPLRQVLSKKQINRLEKLSAQRNGWYVYFYK